MEGKMKWGIVSAPSIKTWGFPFYFTSVIIQHYKI